MSAAWHLLFSVYESSVRVPGAGNIKAKQDAHLAPWSQAKRVRCIDCDLLLAVQSRAVRCTTCAAKHKLKCDRGRHLKRKVNGKFVGRLKDTRPKPV